MSTVGSSTVASSIGVLPSDIYSVNDAVSQLNTQQQQMSTLEQQVSSGLAFSKPSDDPRGVVQAMQLQSALTRSQTYTSTITSATAYTAQANTVLTQAGTSLQQLRTLVLQASNSGNQSTAALSAFATQVTTIGAALASGAATTVNGQPVFADSQQTRNVAPSTTVDVGVTSAAAYGSGTTSLQSVISKIATDLSNGSFASGTTANDDLTALDSATTTLTGAAATVGAQYTSLQSYATQATSLTTSLTSQLSAVQDIDPAKAAVSLQQAQTNYQTSMWATTQVLTQSLVEFLK